MKKNSTTYDISAQSKKNQFSIREVFTLQLIRKKNGRNKIRFLYAECERFELPVPKRYNSFQDCPSTTTLVTLLKYLKSYIS